MQVEAFLSMDALIEESWAKGWRESTIVADWYGDELAPSGILTAFREMARSARIDPTQATYWVTFNARVGKVRVALKQGATGYMLLEQGTALDFLCAARLKFSHGVREAQAADRKENTE